MKDTFGFELLVQTKLNAKKNKLFVISLLVCVIVDLLCLCVQFRWFIEGESDHTNLWMLVCSFAFLIYDLAPSIYLLSLRVTMPQHFNKWIWEAYFGDYENLLRQIETSVSIASHQLEDSVDKVVKQREHEIAEQKQLAAA